MPTETDQYWTATKHPWACVLFILPLLAIYEIGLLVLGPHDVRNGADAWLRSGLSEVGIAPAFGAPLLLITVLLFWGLVCREDRPIDNVGVWVGMTVESAAYAVLLLGLSQGFWLLLMRADHVLGQVNMRASIDVLAAAPEIVWGQLVSYLGAGIYEETLFRLLIFSGLVRLLSIAEETTTRGSIMLAAFSSSLVFAAAHHIGPNGEGFDFYVLTFRTFAGIFFAALYQLRGFGIAVGAHAGYDVLVGLVV